MMRRQTGLSKKCDICIGCGRCTGDKADMHLLYRVNPALSLPSECFKSEKCLVATDIGTTTIVMQLYDQKGNLQDTYARLNPQRKYGPDVLSRIQAAETPEQAAELQRSVLEVLEQGIAGFRQKLEPDEDLQMVISANTTMVYLLMGWNPEELGKAPFTVSHKEAVETTVAQVPTYILPPVSAFVGGDIVAGILAAGMYDSKEITLLIDLGTNGEMVLGNEEKLLACATAAGPAFEGGVNSGVWGADMIRLLSKLRRKGIVDETGLLSDPYFEKGVRIGDVCVTQDAIRAIQLAKGAIAAGVEILLKEYGISVEQVGRVVLAGGFGYYLDPWAAAEIGLLPEALTDRTLAGGNTALAGACRVGGGMVSLREIERVSNRVEILNLAEHPDFYERYPASMNLVPAGFI